MDNFELLTIEEVAKLLKISERTVYDWASKGKLPGAKLGNTWRFKSSDIQAWIDSHFKNNQILTIKSPVKISSVLTPDRVVIMNQKTKKEALEYLIDIISEAKEITDKNKLKEGIFKREELMSTGIGMGIAVPHVRLESVKDLVMAFGVIKTPLEDYQTLDDIPVSIIVMIAAGKNQHAKHIKTLSLITRILKNGNIYQLILNAKSPKDIYQLLIQGE